MQGTRCDTAAVAVAVSAAVCFQVGIGLMLALGVLVAQRRVQGSDPLGRVRVLAVDAQLRSEDQHGDAQHAGEHLHVDLEQSSGAAVGQQHGSSGAAEEPQWDSSGAVYGSRHRHVEGPHGPEDNQQKTGNEGAAQPSARKYSAGEKL